MWPNCGLFRVAIVAASALMVAVGVALPAQAEPPPKQLSVTFTQQLCDGVKGSTRPLPDARLELRVGRRPPVKPPLQLDGQGKVIAPASLIGKRVTATLVLSSPGRLSFGSPTRDIAYRIPLGTRKLSRTSKFQVRTDRANDIANAWWILVLGRDRADFAVPNGVKLKRLRAVAEFDHTLSQRVDDIPNSGYEINHKILYVADTHFRERVPIIHEIGHWLQWYAAKPRAGNLKKHARNDTYPNEPVDIFGEGLSNAFASVALNDASPQQKCGEPYWDLAAVPPTPKLPDAKGHLGQYHEISIAAAMWRLSKVLGGGPSRTQRLAGFAKQIDAMRDYRAVRGRVADTTHSFHDALLEDGAHGSTPERYFAVVDSFGDVGIGWGVAASLYFSNAMFELYDPDQTGKRAGNKIVMTLRAPDGSTCSSEPQSVVEGPIPSVPSDDCWAGAVGIGTKLQHRQLWRLGGTHLDGEYVLEATYVCEPVEWDPDSGEPQSWYNCPGSRVVDIDIGHGAGFLQSDLFGCQQNFTFCVWSINGLVFFGHPNEERVSISGSGTTIMTFRADGSVCYMPVLGRDCAI